MSRSTVKYIDRDFPETQEKFTHRTRKSPLERSARRQRHHEKAGRRLGAICRDIIRAVRKFGEGFIPGTTVVEVIPTLVRWTQRRASALQDAFLRLWRGDVLIFSPERAGYQLNFVSE